MLVSNLLLLNVEPYNCEITCLPYQVDLQPSFNCNTMKDLLSMSPNNQNNINPLTCDINQSNCNLFNNNLTTSGLFNSNSGGGDSLSNNPFSNNPLSNDPLSNNPLSNDPLSNNPLSNDPLSDNSLLNDPLSDNSLSNEPLVQVIPSNSMMISPGTVVLTKYQYVPSITTIVSTQPPVTVNLPQPTLTIQSPPSTLTTTLPPIFITVKTTVTKTDPGFTITSTIPPVFITQPATTFTVIQPYRLPDRTIVDQKPPKTVTLVPRPIVLTQPAQTQYVTLPPITMPATTVFSYIVPRTVSPVIPQIMPMLDQSQLSNPFTDPFSNQFNDSSLNQNPNQFTFPNTNSTSNDLQQPPITTLNSSENTSSIPVNDDEELDKQFATLKKLIDEIGNSKPNSAEQCIIQPTLPMCPTQPPKIKNGCSIDSLMGCSNKPKPADKCSINNIKMCKTSFLSNLTENNNSSSLKGNNLVEKSNLEGKSNLIKNDKTNTENNKKKSLISKMKELLKSKLTTSNLIKQPEIAEAYTENQEPNDTVLLSDLINH